MVGAVDDEVVVSEDRGCVLGEKGGFVESVFDGGVELVELCVRGLDLCGADARGGVDSLAVEVGEFGCVVVEEAEVADSCGGEVEGAGGAEAAEADNKDAGSRKSELAGEAELGEEHLAAVTRVGGGCYGGRWRCGGWGSGWWERAIEPAVGCEFCFEGGEAGAEGGVFLRQRCGGRGGGHGWWVVGWWGCSLAGFGGSRESTERNAHWSKLYFRNVREKGNNYASTSIASPVAVAVAPRSTIVTYFLRSLRSTTCCLR